VELTRAGRLLLGEARDILSRVDRVHTLAQRARDEGVLRAGVPSDLDGSVVAALIAAYRERSPGLLLDLRPMTAAEQVRGLGDGTLDAGILRLPCDTRGLAVGPVLARTVGVLLPPDSPLAASPEVHLADLAGHGLVVHPRHEAPGAYDELLAACRRHGFVPAVIHESSHPQFTLGLVLAGTAVAVVPDGAHAPDTVWRPLLGDAPTWNYTCAAREGNGPTGQVSEDVTDFVTVATHVLSTRAAMREPGRPAASRVVVRPASGFLA